MRALFHHELRQAWHQSIVRRQGIWTHTAGVEYRGGAHNLVLHEGGVHASAAQLHQVGIASDDNRGTVIATLHTVQPLSMVDPPTGQEPCQTGCMQQTVFVDLTREGGLSFLRQYYGKFLL